MEILVKFFLLVTAGFFAYVFLLFFINIEAPDGYKNAFLLVSAVIPLLGIAFALQSSSYVFKRNYVFVLLYDNKMGRLLVGQEGSPYSFRYMNMFLNLDDADLAIGKNLNYSRGTDFIEYGIVNALTVNFMGNWDLERIVNEVPGGEVTISTSGSLGMDKKHQVTASHIYSIFSHNPFLKNENKYSGFGFYLPDGSTIQAKVEEGYPRTIIIENIETIIQIPVTPTLSHPIQQGIPGVVQKDTEDMNRYSVINYLVEIKAHFNILWPIKWKRREALMRWHENIGATLEKFDWKLVDENIKENRKQKAVDLILRDVSSPLTQGGGENRGPTVK